MWESTLNSNDTLLSPRVLPISLQQNNPGSHGPVQDSSTFLLFMPLPPSPLPSIFLFMSRVTNFQRSLIMSLLFLKFSNSLLHGGECQDSSQSGTNTTAPSSSPSSPQHHWTPQLDGTSHLPWLGGALRGSMSFGTYILSTVTSKFTWNLRMPTSLD